MRFSTLHTVGEANLKMSLCESCPIQDPWKTSYISTGKMISASLYFGLSTRELTAMGRIDVDHMPADKPVQQNAERRRPLISVQFLRIPILGCTAVVQSMR